MARVDYVTGKRAQTGNKRSHAMNASKRKFNLNLKKIKIVEDGKVKVVRVTVKTARTLYKNQSATA